MRDLPALQRWEPPGGQTAGEAIGAAEDSPVLLRFRGQWELRRRVCYLGGTGVMGFGSCGQVIQDLGKGIIREIGLFEILGL